MGDPIRQPAPIPAEQTDTGRRFRSMRLDATCWLIDFVVTRGLALAAAVALLRGEATPATAGVIWAVAYLLRHQGRG